MKKWFSFFFVSILLILFSFVAFLYIQRAPIISHHLSQITGLETRIKELHISRKGLEVRGMSISAPPKSPFKELLSTESIAIELQWSQFFSFLRKGIIIDSITVKSPRIGLEILAIGIGETNWKKLFKEKQKEEKNGEKRTPFLIKKLLLTNIQLELKTATLLEVTLHPTPIESIEITDIGKEKAFSFEGLFIDLLLQLSDKLAKKTKLFELPSLKSEKKENQ